MCSQTTSNHTEAPPRVEVAASAQTFEEAGFRLSPPVLAPRQPSRPGDPKQLSLLKGDVPLRGEPSAAPSDGPAKRDVAPLIQYIVNRCNDAFGEGENESEEVEVVERILTKVKPCRCRKWFCPKCAPSMGRSLKYRLRERLQQFQGVYGITLTLDGSLFPSPYDGYRYVMGNRCLSRFVQKLFNAGHLKSRDFFWVVEFQQFTEQAHWHMLVNSLFIPFGVLVAVWSSFRPRWAPKLPEKITAENYKGKAPGFGSVRFTLQKAAPHRAAGYACKYLVKVPDYGFPDWVLDHDGNVPRYGRSRGFFPPKVETTKREAKPFSTGRIHPPECACEDCLNGITLPGHQKRRLRTLRDRLAQCEESSYIVNIPLVRDEEGRLVEGKPAYRGQLSVPFANVCEEFGVSEATEVIVPSASDERLRILEYKHGGLGSDDLDEEF